jgi:N-acetylglucosaminyldiphosphoundecaprenol N-acetyl-beta-D-mannosaminyltransferase
MEQINSSEADFLVAALGAKKGQIWLHRNRDRLRVPIRAHLGATINFQAGAIKRAPYLMQKLGLEWLWRIKEEPSLFKRYWHDGRTLLRLLPTRILPLAATARWHKHGRGGGRHDFVIVGAQSEQTVRLRISGRATGQHVPKAVARFREALGKQKEIIVDLSQTQAIDARFFGLLLMLRKELISRGSTLQFAGIAPALEKQFRLNGVGYLLPSKEHHNETP